MALNVVQVPSTTIQPAGGTTPTDLQAETALAGAQAKTAAATEQVAGQVEQFSANIMREESLKLAQEHGTQAVTYDADGKPMINPSAKGWGGYVYNQAFNEAAVAKFNAASLNDLQRQADIALTRNPGDPDAVHQELTTYTKGRLDAMPPEFRKTLEPSFAGVINAARQSAVAGKIRSDIAGVTGGLAQDRQSIVLDMARDRYSPAYDALPHDQKVVIDADLERRQDDLDKRKRAANVPEETIRREREAIDVEALAHSKGIELGTWVAEAQPGENRLGAALNRIDEQVMQKGVTAHSALMRQIMEGYVQRGASKLSAAESASSQRIAQVAARSELEIRRTQGWLNDGTLTFEQANNELARIDRGKAAAMEGLRPTQQLQILSAGAGILENALAGHSVMMQQGAARADANIQQAYTATATTAQNMTYHGATQAEKNAGYVQLNDLVTDKRVIEKAETDPAYAQILSTSRRAMADHTAEALTYDRATAWQRVRSGIIDPKFHADVFNEGLDSGAIGGAGGISVAQATAYMDEGSRNFEKAKQIRAYAQEGAQAWRDGKPLTQPQQAAMEALARDPNGLGVSNGQMITSAVPGAGPGTTVNAQGLTSSKPVGITMQDASNLHDHVRANGWVPAEYVKALQGSPDTLPADMQKAFVNMVRGTMAIWGDAYGRTMSDPEQIEGLVYDQTVKTFGVDVFTRVGTYEKGYAKKDGATAEDVQKDRQQPPSGRVATAAERSGLTQLSQINSQVQDAVDHPYNSFWQGVSRALDSDFGSKGPEWSADYQSLQKEGARKLLSKILPEGADGPVWASPDFQEMLAKYTVQEHYPKYKNMDERHGFNSQERATMAFLQNFNDRISARVELDPDTGKNRTVLHIDGYENVMKRANGKLSWDDATIRTMTENRIFALRPDLAEKSIPGTLEITSQRAPTGKMLYRASAMAIGRQGPIDLGFVDPTDKRWSVEIEPMAKSVAGLMDERAANSLFTRLWTMQYRRPEFAAELAKEMVDQSDRSKDPTQSAANVVRWLRAAVGTIDGVSDEDWSKAANPAFIRAMREHGALQVIFGAGDATKGRLFDTTRPSFKGNIEAQYPTTPGQSEIVQTGQAQAARDAAAARIRARSGRLPQAPVVPPPSF